MKKNHVFRPDAGEGLELRLAPSGVVTGVAAAIASVDSHGEHASKEHAPKHHVPKEHAPKHHAPKEHAPKHHGKK